MNERMSQISSEHELAEKYLQRSKTVSEAEGNNRKRVEKLEQKQHLYNLTKKKIENFTLSKQQLYHNLLVLF